jgi:hypothetical protein
VGHRGRHAPRERLDEGKTGGDPGTLTGDERLTLHLSSFGLTDELKGNGSTIRKANQKQKPTGSLNLLMLK